MFRSNFLFTPSSMWRKLLLNCISYSGYKKFYFSNLTTFSYGNKLYSNYMRLSSSYVTSRLKRNTFPNSCCYISNLSNSPTTITSYEEERKTFSVNVPDFFNFTSDVIQHWATCQKDDENPTKALAIWWIDDNGQEIKWTFKDLIKLTNKVTNILQVSCGLQKGDCVMIILPRIPEWWLLNLAAFKAGTIACPGTIQLRAADIKYRLLKSGAKCIVASDETRSFIDECADSCPDLKKKLYVGSQSSKCSSWLNFTELMDTASDSAEGVKTRASDPMMWFFTSGTTSHPKMTEHTHASYGIASLSITRYLLTATPTDVIWNLADTGWAKSAWSSLFAPWLGGACVFIHHTTNHKFDSNSLLQILEKYNISVFCAPPTALRLFVQEDLSKYKFKSLRHCVSGGEPVNEELISQWKKGTGLELYEVYGQTETTLLCGNYPFLERKIRSMGKASPGINLQIVNDEGEVQPPGTLGNLAICCKPDRPVGLFSRYVGEPKLTESVFRGDYYLTGDKCKMDEDGYIWFIGRNDDIILSSGYRIGPFEVESALIQHPAVLESAVVRSPDPVRGEIVMAFVILAQKYQNSNTDELKKELQEHVKSITAPYKYPRRIKFVTELPKTISGKIRRVELRKPEWQID
ncbi:acyl-coenzyme A synthetase ACSM3, mitochondrial [Octopus sinensis]|uniref:medium-chain acyl-CoA ligase n=1 Tax=Octopus sinensis TaxID=2607531 RepID=A0A6P7SE41_9MOLL|nr:acyl-coenzyme A synthetase ACSM3, mitochondrial [Octopus sinensis]